MRWNSVFSTEAMSSARALNADMYKNNATTIVRNIAAPPIKFSLKFLRQISPNGFKCAVQHEN
jgi:hypothetical protein